jgi:predicted acylesterase/phospholipase RssA
VYGCSQCIRRRQERILLAQSQARADDPAKENPWFGLNIQAQMPVWQLLAATGEGVTAFWLYRKGRTRRLRVATDSQLVSQEQTSGTHWFALCLSGGVALGSYIAGVLTQLYRDLYVINETVREDRLPAFRIDAIAGSSAGSITGLLLTRALTTNATPAQFEEAMRACWVDGLDIQNLLGDSTDPANSAFASGFIDELSRNAFESLPAPSAGELDRHSAVALWMTMSNLDGIPFCIDFERPMHAQAGATTFFAYSYRDYDPYIAVSGTLYRVNIPVEDLEQFDWGQPFKPRGLHKVPEPWEDAKASAITSGSFPIAFPSRVMNRNLDLYPAVKELNRHGVPHETEARYHYTDGGLFNNQPIGRAIDAVSYLRRFSSSHEGPRTYLVIEPDPNTPESVMRKASDVAESTSRSEDGLPPHAVLGRIFGAYFTDALYSDFQKAAETNKRVREFNATLDSIGSAVSDDQKRALRKAAGLGYKEEITLERIPAPLPVADRLSGDFLGHFGGFLHPDLREADFQVGAREARAWVVDWLACWYAIHRNANVEQGKRWAEGLLDASAGEGDILHPHPGEADHLPSTASATWNSAPLDPGRRAAIVNAANKRLTVLLNRMLPSLIRRTISSWLLTAGTVIGLLTGAGASALIALNTGWPVHVSVYAGAVAGAVAVATIMASVLWQFLGPFSAEEAPEPVMHLSATERP